MLVNEVKGEVEKTLLGVKEEEYQKLHRNFFELVYKDKILE